LDDRTVNQVSHFLEDAVYCQPIRNPSSMATPHGENSTAIIFKTISSAFFSSLRLQQLPELLLVFERFFSGFTHLFHQPCDRFAARISPAVDAYDEAVHDVFPSVDHGVEIP
jgi:hypothetical protein